MQRSRHSPEIVSQEGETNSLVIEECFKKHKTKNSGLCCVILVPPHLEILPVREKE